MQEVLFAPLTCIELLSARSEKTAVFLEMAVSINLMAPTIEKVVAKLKTSHLDLVRLFREDFKAQGLPDEALGQLRQCEATAIARDGTWFNDAAHFKDATAAAFEARAVTK